MATRTTPKGRSFILGKRHSGETGAERRAKTKKKREDLLCLPNGRAEPLDKSF